MSDRFVGSGGPLGPFVEGFASELRRLGYTPVTASRHLSLLADLSHWLEDVGVAPAGLTTETAVEFVQDRRRRGQARFISPMGVGTVLDYLREAGVVPEASRPAPVGPTEQLLERYYRFLVEDRGLTDAVVAQYETGARLFVDFLAERDVELPEATAHDVSTFVTRHCARPVKLAPPELASILRAFLRFLQVEGVTMLPLAQAVPPVASRIDRSLPRALPPGHPGRLLRSCDRRTARGRRDYAILVVLTRLGLRAGEIVGLVLEDFDWRAGEVLIHGKGRRDELLPLPADVGEAVVGYLRRGRPRTDCRAVFVRTAAPLRGLTRQAVTQVVYSACDRAGVPRAGAHRLRHTLATELLAAGTSLTEIGQVLRHRSISTTAIYAKVDHTALRELAVPWPGGAA
jgi:integrase/recombinase XerD